MKERIEKLEILILNYTKAGIILPSEIDVLKWELKALKAKQEKQEAIDVLNALYNAGFWTLPICVLGDVDQTVLWDEAKRVLKNHKESQNAEK